MQIKNMKIRAKHVGIGVLTFNIGLVVLTFGLSQQARIQHPMKGTLVSIDDASIHVIESMPDGYEKPDDAAFDALVLIHGASTSALDFSTNLFPELSKRYPVVALDRPGHGYSDRGSRPQINNPGQQAGVILDTLAQMDIERPVLIGHSWGGAVVLAALLKRHDTVKPVAGVLIAGVSHPYEREDSLPTKLALAPYYGPVFRWQYLSPIGRFAIAPTVKRFFAPDEVPENYIHDTGLYLSLRPNTYLYNAQDRSGLSDRLVDQSKHYADISIPLMSIAASDDQVVPPVDHHDKLIDVLPDVQAVEVSDAGHSPHHTHMNEVIDAIEAFVGELN